MEIEADVKLTSVDDFLKGRDLGEARTVMLKYLEKVSDNIDIMVKTGGNSVIKCYFDCGAYKGEEVLTFRIKNLCPFEIAASLKSLTSGHHFSFKHEEEYMIKRMANRTPQPG